MIWNTCASGGAIWGRSAGPLEGRSFRAGRRREGVTFIIIVIIIFSPIFFFFFVVVIIVVVIVRQLA